MSNAQAEITGIDQLTPGTWQLDASHSSVEFSAQHLMVSKVRGRFTSFNGTLEIAEDPLQSSLQASVDLDSVETHGRLAGEGYSALAVDLLSEEGGTASLTESGAATAALGNAPPQRLVADLRAGLDELARRAPGTKLGMVGFCFGGAMT